MAIETGLRWPKRAVSSVVFAGQVTVVSMMQVLGPKAAVSGSKGAFPGSKGADSGPKGAVRPKVGE